MVVVTSHMPESMDTLLSAIAELISRVRIENSNVERISAYLNKLNERLILQILFIATINNRCDNK